MGVYILCPAAFGSEIVRATCSRSGSLKGLTCLTQLSH